MTGVCDECNAHGAIYDDGEAYVCTDNRACQLRRAIHDIERLDDPTNSGVKECAIEHVEAALRALTEKE